MCRKRNKQRVKEENNNNNNNNSLLQLWTPVTFPIMFRCPRRLDKPIVQGQRTHDGLIALATLLELLNI
jgi:hypothetical protein